MFQLLNRQVDLLKKVLINLPSCFKYKEIENHTPKSEVIASSGFVMNQPQLALTLCYLPFFLASRPFSHSHCLRFAPPPPLLKHFPLKPSTVLRWTRHTLFTTSYSHGALFSLVMHSEWWPYMYWKLFFWIYLNHVDEGLNKNSKVSGFSKRC